MSKVVLTGGGTYGHVSPLEPIIGQLRMADKDSQTLFIGMKNDRFSELLTTPEHVDYTAQIHSGKYRRYPDEPLVKRIFDIKTHLLNLRDGFLILYGTIQAYRLLRSFKPELVFGNGGYVSVPVGWAARLLKIPVVIHESDSKPGIANRLLAKNSKLICLGMPLTKDGGLFSNPDKTVFTGIPTREAFVESAAQGKATLRKGLKLDEKRPLITISGGSQGAEAINNAIVLALPNLLKEYQVVHIAGDGNIQDVRMQTDKLGVDLKHYHLVGFTDKIDQFFGASDLVVTRASATTFSELAILGTPTILIPAPHLSDQIENAKVATRQGAAVLLHEGDSQLADTVISLMSDKQERMRLSKGIQKLAKPDSAKQIAQIILSGGKRG